MGNGLGQTAESPPDRPANFFENTETVYQMTTDRLSGFANRLDSLSDSINGQQAEDVSKANALEAAAPHSYFDRCKLAEQNLSNMIERLDSAVHRLESIGLI